MPDKNTLLSIPKNSSNRVVFTKPLDDTLFSPTVFKFVVPNDKDTLHVIGCGAGGAGGGGQNGPTAGGAGGGGAPVFEGDIPVVPGEVLYITLAPPSQGGVNGASGTSGASGGITYITGKLVELALPGGNGGGPGAANTGGAAIHGTHNGERGVLSLGGGSYINTNSVSSVFDGAGANGQTGAPYAGGGGGGSYGSGTNQTTDGSVNSPADYVKIAGPGAGGGGQVGGNNGLGNCGGPGIVIISY